MKLINIFILVFLMSAFAIGVSYGDNDIQKLEEGMDNVSMTMQNITLDRTGDQYTDGMFTILEKFISFIGVSFVEIMRLGILFGNENPEYFEVTFIFSIIKLIIWLVIISLLIQPMFYLIVFIIMLVIWTKDKIKKHNKQR